MKNFFFSFIFTCLVAFTANGQVNLIDTLRSDSLGSNCSYGVETNNKYIFNSNYGVQLQLYAQPPYKGSSLISIDKTTLQKTVRYHLNSTDTSWYINYLFQKGDTIHTIENALYTDSTYNCKTVRICKNEYDENLNLIQSKTIDIVKNDSIIYGQNYLVSHNDKHICLSTGSIHNSSYRGVFWIVDINTDSVLLARARLTYFLDSTRFEMLHYISVNDSGDFLISGLGLGDNSMNGSQVVKLISSNNYISHVIYSPHTYSIPDYFATFLWAHSFVTEKNHCFYSTAQGFCEHDSTASSNGSFSKGLTFIKSYEHDSSLFAYRGICAPLDSTPYTFPIDIQVPTALNPIRFINDHVFVDIHPTHVDENFTFYTPCQSYPGRMEIVYWDTTLSVLQRTWIKNPNENFYINGFYETQQKDLMVYGYMCGLNHSNDSSHLFAFLLDKTSGHLLSIFNANDFISEIDYEVFPNPFYEQITIKRPIPKQETFCLYDSFGKLILTKTLEENKEQINTSNLAEGLYFYSIVNHNGERVKAGKVVKE